EDVLAKISKKKPRTEKPRVAASLASRELDRVAIYVRAALRGAAARVSGTHEGSRNDTLNREAYAFGRLLGTDVIARDEVVAALAAAAAAAGLPEEEARRTIESGLAAGEEDPRAASEIFEKSQAKDAAKQGGARPTILVVGGELPRIVDEAEA